MGLVEHAKAELNILLEQAKKDKDPMAVKMQEHINNDLLEMVKVFSEQGHSGFSAGYALSCLTKLLDYKPLTSLTGAEDEWGEPYNCGGNKLTQQNKRCTGVFRDNMDNSTARMIDGIIYSDNGGVTWFSKGGGLSCIPVTFPFVPPKEPKRVYIKYTDAEEENWVEVTDPEEIKAMAKAFRDEVDKAYAEEE